MSMTVTVNYPDDLTEVQDILLNIMVEYAFSILEPHEIDALIEHADELIAMEENKE